MGLKYRKNVGTCGFAARCWISRNHPIFDVWPALSPSVTWSQNVTLRTNRFLTSSKAALTNREIISVSSGEAGSSRTLGEFREIPSIWAAVRRDQGRNSCGMIGVWEANLRRIGSRFWAQSWAQLGSSIGLVWTQAGLTCSGPEKQAPKTHSNCRHCGPERHAAVRKSKHPKRTLIVDIAVRKDMQRSGKASTQNALKL